MRQLRDRDRRANAKNQHGAQRRHHRLVFQKAPRLHTFLPIKRASPQTRASEPALYCSPATTEKYHQRNMTVPDRDLPHRD